MFLRQTVSSSKNILSSLGDVVGDWIFVTTIAGTQYFWPALGSTVLGTVFAILTIVHGIRSCVSTTLQADADAAECSCCSAVVLSPRGCKLGCLPFLTRKDVYQLLEIFLEDIPQIALSFLVRLDNSSWTPSMVLNLATSAYNVIFNILDILEEKEDEGEVQADASNTNETESHAVAY